MCGDLALKLKKAKLSNELFTAKFNIHLYCGSTYELNDALQLIERLLLMHVNMETEILRAFLWKKNF